MLVGATCAMLTADTATTPFLLEYFQTFNNGVHYYFNSRASCNGLTMSKLAFVKPNNLHKG